MSVADRVQNRIEYHGSHEEIEELCLDGIEVGAFTPELSGLIANCFNTEYLTLNECSLASFRHFPHLPKLIAIEAIDNKYIPQHVGSRVPT